MIAAIPYRDFSVQTHADCMYVDHVGYCDIQAARLRLPQIREGLRELYQVHERVAMIHSLLHTTDIDFPSRAKYVALALEFAPRRPLWIVVVRSTAFHIIVRAAALAAGQTVAVTSTMSEASEIARRQSYDPDPYWR